MLYKFHIRQVAEGYQVTEDSLRYPPGGGVHPSLERAMESVERACGTSLPWEGSKEGPVKWTASIELQEFTRRVNMTLLSEPKEAA